MKYNHPLKQILSQTRPYWDQDRTRDSVRGAFRKALQCRTPELGAEVFASPNQELILYHSCRSRACPSCGYRGTVQWLRERWAALPDGRYKGITFTMPDLLWPFFHDNPALAKALPALAAEVIKARVSAEHALRVGVVAILHTFNGKLEFNSHVHTLVTGGGLHESTGAWVPSVYYDREHLMKSWRKAVIALLRTALKADQLQTELNVEEGEDLFTHLDRCWWSIRVQAFKSKGHFLRYAARYLRRPPIAQRRITGIEERRIRFWAKDKKLCCRVLVECMPEEFIDRWAQHIPGDYQHAIGNFGLFAPRSLGQSRAAIFAILGQKRKPRPKPRPWADSIKRDFGRNPLLDHKGQQMKRVRRLKPVGGPVSVNFNSGRRE